MPVRILLILSLSLISACGGGSSARSGDGKSTSSLTGTATVTNQAPLAQARADGAVEAGSIVTLDGSASSDPDGSIGGYTWSQVSGAAVSLASVSGRFATFTAPPVAAPQVLRFRLTVTDDGGASASDLVDVTVRPARHAISGMIRAAQDMAADGDVNDPEAPRTPNDSPQAAQRLTAPVVLGGYAAVVGAGRPGALERSGDTSDWFRVQLDSDQTVTLTVAEPESADLDLYLWTASGDRLLNASVGSGGIETLSVDSSGEYLVEVAPERGASNYALVVSDVGIPGIQSGLRLSDDFVPGEIIVERHTDSVSRAAGTAVAKWSRPTGTGSGPVLVSIGAEQAALASPASARRSGRGVDRSPALDDPAMRLKLATLLEIKALRLDPSVAYAQPNFRIRSQAVPDDPFFPLQWHYSLIRLPAAWELSRGAAAVTVAVLDSGVLTHHPDLSGQLLPGYDFVRSATSSGDGDGLDDDPTDPGAGEPGATASYHGTHVTGTVAAISGNGIGAAGVAPGVKILPVRVLGLRGGSSYDIVQGLRYAAGLSNDSGTLAAPADVINLSLGRKGRCWPAEQAAFDAAREAGVVVVAAAGNQGIDAAGAFPAACEHVLAVGAVGADRQSSSYSNWGAAVDVKAPGGRSWDADGDGHPDGVLSLGGDEAAGRLRYTYTYKSGTSMASPHVAGVLALMKSINPALTPVWIEQLLAAGELTDDDGVIDAYRAVFTALNGSALPPDAGPRITVSPAALNFGATYNYAEIDVRLGEGGAVINQAKADRDWLQVSPLPSRGSVGRFAVHVDRSLLTEGTYANAITVTAAGATAQLPVIVRVAGAAPGSDAGHLYVLLRDAASGQIVQQVQAAGGNGRYTYDFAAVPVGTYELIAGTDADNDGSICDAGESCGIYRTPDGATAIAVRSDASGLDFSVGWLVSVTGTTSVTARAAVRLDQAEAVGS